MVFYSLFTNLLTNRHHSIIINISHLGDDLSAGIKKAIRYGH
jgi:hypothetical protein